ncbi:hypothetical protein [Saccharicrinis sp. FJH54]|uniref:DUF7670 domain-containing protein n=1 Tax=Saccharicrinis sp. FJH54 TaxID=3344665 RepID=UPI0035D507F1
MNKKNKILFRLPRVISILAILFVSMFAFDAFEPDLTVWQQVKAFMIHLVPSFILTLLLILAWSKQLVGGIAFTVVGLVFTPFIYTHNYSMNHSVGISIGIVLMISFPFVVVGVLFILGHLLSKKISR